MNKHTEGKWVINDSWITPKSNEFAIAKVFQENPISKGEEAKANLKLIAAAPDLLDALKEAKTIIYNLGIKKEHRSEIELQQVMDIAINKATL